MAEGGGIEPHWLVTSPPLSRRLGDHSPAPSVLLNWCPRRDLHSHSRRNWFLRPARIHFATRAWSTDPDSNRIRTGLQSAASTASAFSAQKTTNKLWLGRKDSNLLTLGSEPSAVAAVLLPNMALVAGLGIEPSSPGLQPGAFT